MPRAHVNGLELEYESFGDPAATPLLLVMGLSYQMIEWDDDLCTLIAERGFRVTRFDNRDVGLSTKLDALGPPNLMAVLAGKAGPPYSLDDMAANSGGVLDALRRRRGPHRRCVDGGHDRPPDRDPSPGARSQSDVDHVDGRRSECRAARACRGGDAHRAAGPNTRGARRAVAGKSKAHFRQRRAVSTNSGRAGRRRVRSIAASTPMAGCGSSPQSPRHRIEHRHSES